MNISDALIEERSGRPIVPGRIAITGPDLSAQLLPVPQHDHVLFELDNNSNLRLEVVASFERSKTAFCTISAAAPRLTLGGIGPLVTRLLTTSAQQGRTCTEECISGTVYDENRKPVFSITTFNIRVARASGGFNIRIIGRFADRLLSYPGEPPNIPPAESGFSIEMLIPWATVLIKGYGTGPGWDQQGTVIKAGRRIRDPACLSDLRIERVHAWLYVDGFVALYPRDEFKKDSREGLQQTISLAFGQRQGLQFGANDVPDPLTSGFVKSTARYSSPADRSLSLGLIGREWLERALSIRDKADVTCRGDEIGRVGYYTGYADEPGDPLRSIGQTISAFELRAELTTEGLQLAVRGTLNPYDPQEFEIHKRERGSHLQPDSDFEAMAILPWAALIVRDFRILSRRQHLLKPSS